MAEAAISIEGMSCQHCVMSVKKALDRLDGVTSSEVAIGSAKVTYDDTRTGIQEIAKAVQDAGYKVKNI